MKKKITKKSAKKHRKRRNKKAEANYVNPNCVTPFIDPFIPIVGTNQPLLKRGDLVTTIKTLVQIYQR